MKSVTSINQIYLKITLPFLIAVIFGCSQNEKQTSELIGTWKIACSTDMSVGEHEIRSVIFEDNIIIKNLTYFEDSNCLLPKFTAESIAQYTKGEQIEISTGETVTELDLTFVSASITPENDKITTSFNDDTYCDFSGWSNGVKIDVSTCPDLNNSKYSYGIVFVDHNNLYFGDTDTGSGDSIDERANLLNNKYYTKE